MNTKIELLYRDADNYKKFSSCILLGEMSQQQEEKIRARLYDGEFLIPSAVGLFGERFGEETEADHPWFTWLGVEMTDAPATVPMHVDKLVANFEHVDFEKVEAGKVKPYRVHVCELRAKNIIVWAKDKHTAIEAANQLCLSGQIDCEDAAGIFDCDGNQPSVEAEDLCTLEVCCADEKEEK